MDNLQGQCTFELLAPDDLLDALRTLKGKDGDGVFVPAPGEGSEPLMQWALSDVEAASTAPNAKECLRHSTNAVMNARRALSCVVDWYLRRDGLVFCSDAPKQADEKAAILVRRRVVDELSTRVLARAIDIRNQAEHNYRAVPVDQAEDIVELIRLTIQCMRAGSEPDRGPFIFGMISGGVYYGPEGHRGLFHGWNSAVAVLDTFAPEPWIGVIVPSDKIKATVRKVRLKDLTVKLLLESLDVLEGTFGRISSYGDITGRQVRAAAAGFL